MFRIIAMYSLVVISQYSPPLESLMNLWDVPIQVNKKCNILCLNLGYNLSVLLLHCVSIIINMCLTTITVTSTWILISAYTIVCIYAKHAINSQNFKFKGVRNDHYYKKDIASYFIKFNPYSWLTAVCRQYICQK